MVQQLRYAEYERTHGPVYGDLLDRLDDLITVDVARHREADDPQSLYVQRGEGGHYSPETNRRIADVLNRAVFDR